MSCEAELPVDNGNVSKATNGTTTIAEYTCAVGYELVGATTLICMTNGTWDSVQPQCCRLSDENNVTQLKQ